MIPETGSRGVADTWFECQKIVSGRKGARYKGFPTRELAEEWLAGGASYETHKPDLERGIYFDSGTGRGLGMVEINVTDETGRMLLDTVLNKKNISKFGTHMIADRLASNNFGELFALKYALIIAMKQGIKKVFGDSKLVLEYWSKGRIKANVFSDDAYAMADEVTGLRKEFEADGGVIRYVSGDDNPADLGFHR